VTKFGRPWVRTKPRESGPDTPIDIIGLEFRRLLKRLGLFKPGRSFYALRHTYRTVADACKDQRAIDLTMGHASDHISTHYVERIGDDRLEAIAGHVRAWLFGKKGS
jgi:integrase